jgi:hypothetical protein
VHLLFGRQQRTPADLLQVQAGRIGIVRGWVIVVAPGRGHVAVAVGVAAGQIGEVAAMRRRSSCSPREPR